MKKRDFDTKQRFGFRKYKWVAGAASVLLGTSIVFGIQTNTAHAATTDDAGSTTETTTLDVGNSGQGANTGAGTQALGESKVADVGSDDGNGGLHHNDDGSWTIGGESGLDDNGDPKHENHDIDFAGNSNSQKINYKDDQGQPAVDKNGKPLDPGYAGNDGSGSGHGTGPVTHSGDTVDVPIPDGWKPKNPDDTKTTLTPDSNGTVPDKEVTIDHGEYKTPEGDKSKKGSQIPSTDTQKTGVDNTFAQDMEHETNTTLERDFKYDFSGVGAATKTKENITDNSVTESDQTTSKRSVTVDTVTGQITKRDDWNVADTVFNSYHVRQIAGYAVKIVDEQGHAVELNNGEIAGEHVTSDQINQLNADANGKRIFHTYTITYTAQDGHKNVRFVDKNGNPLTDPDNKDSYGDVIQNSQVTGKVDSDVTNVDNIIPKGWRLADGEPTIHIPNTITDQDTAIDVKIEHDTKVYDPGADVPKGSPAITGDGGSAKTDLDINDSTLKKSISRVITGSRPDGSKIDETQTLDFQRNATVDLVNGHVTYGDWTPVQADKNSFAEYDVTPVNGYTTHINGTVSDKVDAQNNLSSADVDGWNADAHKYTISFTANSTSQNFHYVNEDGSQATDADGKAIADTQNDGKTDDPIGKPSIPAGWDFVKAEKGGHTYTDPADLANVKFDPAGTPNNTVTVTIKHHDTVINPDDTKPTSNDPDNHGKNKGDKTESGKDIDHDVQYKDLHQSITQVVNQTLPGKEQSQLDSQTINYERTAHIDEVTGKVTFDAWHAVGDKTSFTDVNATKADGYTPSQETVTAPTPSDDQITSWNNNDHIVNITYTANDSHQTFHYEDKNGAPVTDGKGQTITDKTVDGKTDGKITNPDIPGFVVNKVTKNGQDVTDDYKNGKLTFDPDDQKQTITVTVSHDQETIKPGDTTLDPKDPNNKGKDKGTAVPGGGQIKHDVQYNDLHKTINEHVSAVDPHTGEHTVSDQSISFERTATIDQVTGDVTFGDWTVADSSAQKSFTKVDAPVVDGYTASKASVDAPAIDNNSVENWKDADHNIQITYTANNAHQDYIFRDRDNNIIGMDGNKTTDDKSTSVNGKTDETVNAPQLPAGWVLDDGQSPLTNPTLKPDDESKAIEVHVKHGSKTVGPNDVPNQGDKVSGGHTTPGDGKPTNEITHDDLYKTITRNVTITDPHSGATQHNESISYTRTANIDTVTGDVTYNPWTPVDSTKNSFGKVDVPSVPGYTSHIDGGTTADLDAKTPLNDEITNWTDKNITVTYTADNSSQKIVYHDTEHNTDVNTQDLKGQTDGKITPTVPVGYDVDKVTKGGNDITADFKNGNLKFDPADQTQEIVVNVHQHVDDIKASDTHSGDKTHGDDTKPGNESGDPTVLGHNGDNDPKLNNDVDYDALHRTVTQTVDKYDKKGAKTGTDTQTVYYERDAYVNRATGHVTYTDWRAVNNFTDNATTGAKTGFNEVSIDDVAGYTHNGPVAAWTPSQEQLSGYETVHTIKGTDLKYTANSNTITYQFVDDDKSGENVGDVITLTGDTDTNVSASAVTDTWNALKDKYELVDPSQLPTTVAIKADNGQMPRLIHLKHISEEITKNHIPSGATDKDDKHAITDKDFSHDVTRTITINTPSGNVTVDDQGHQTVASTPHDASQTITLTRTGKYDKVTGEVTWNPWQSGHFNAVNVPSVNGYTPSQPTIDAVENVGADYNDPKINVTYTAKDASQKIHYVDENGNDLVDPKDASGNDVKDGTATGVTDETVNVPVPDGWDLVDNGDSTTKLENPDTNGEVTTKAVKIKHGTVVVDHKDSHSNTDLVDPNKPNGPRYDGVTDEDLNQEAIRTFVFYLPANTKAEEYQHNFTETAQTKVTFDAKANTVTVTQTVGFYRDAVVDKITGKVVGYKAKNGIFIKLGTEHDHGWIPSDASNGRFEAIMFQQIKGYTPGVRVTGPKKSVNMMVKPALFRTAMFYNVSFFANATFEKPEEKEIPEKAGNQDVIPSNKTTGKDTEPAKYVPENPIQNGKGDPVKTTDGKGTTPDLPQKLETKPDQKPDDKNKGKDNNTNPVISSDNKDNTPSTPVISNTSKRDDTQKQEPEQKTGEQKTVDNTKKAPAKKNVKKHAKKSVKKGVKKSAKVTKKAPAKRVPTSTTAPVAPGKKQAPISNAKSNVVDTTATIKTPVANSSKKTLPQTGNKENAGLTAFGAVMTALSGLVGLFGFKKRKHED